MTGRDRQQISDIVKAISNVVWWQIVCVEISEVEKVANRIRVLYLRKAAETRYVSERLNTEFPMKLLMDPGQEYLDLLPARLDMIRGRHFSRADSLSHVFEQPEVLAQSSLNVPGVGKLQAKVVFRVLASMTLGAVLGQEWSDIRVEVDSCSPLGGGQLNLGRWLTWLRLAYQGERKR
jgi:hypothetical protein